MSLEVRTLEESDLADWLRALNAGFLNQAAVTAEEVEIRRAGTDLDRTQGAFDEGRCVATFRSMPRELTVPGGAALAACAVTNVSVTATHRRKGLASLMMANELSAARERGEAVSILVAAEYPIYGRFGYGPATWVTDWQVDVPRTGLDRRWSGPEDGGRIDLVTPADVLKSGPELHDRVRRQTPGAISRTHRWWELATGEVVTPSRGWKEPFFALYRDASGRIDGLAVYDAVDHPWPGKLPKVTLELRSLIAATPAAESALWRFLLSVDWVTELKTGHRAPDDILPLLLSDPRAAKVDTYADFMWLRVLDVPRALGARTYQGPGTFVLEVHDAAGFAGGRYRLETDAQGIADCRPTTESADLALDVAELGRLYLGDESAVRLAALRRIAEERPGAASRADALFRTSRRPWCPEIF